MIRHLPSIGALAAPVFAASSDAKGVSVRVQCDAEIPAGFIDLTARWQSAGLPIHHQRRLLAREGSQDFRDLVGFLNRWASDLAVCAGQQETPLHLAAFTSNPGALKALVLCGVDIDARDQTGASALLHAAENPSANLVEVLLAFGADIGAADHAGDTALHKAAASASLAAACSLVAAGADAWAENKQGLTPLEVADPTILECLNNALDARNHATQPGALAFSFPLPGEGDETQSNTAVDTLTRWASLSASNSVAAAAPTDDKTSARGMKRPRSFGKMEDAVAAGNTAEVRKLIEAGAADELDQQHIEKLIALARNAEDRELADLLRRALADTPAESTPPPKPAEKPPRNALAECIDGLQKDCPPDHPQRAEILSFLACCRAAPAFDDPYPDVERFERIFDRLLLGGGQAEAFSGGVALMLDGQGIGMRPSFAEGHPDDTWLHRLARLGRVADEAQNRESISLIERFVLLEVAGLPLASARLHDDPRWVAFRAENRDTLRALVSIDLSRPPHNPPVDTALHRAADLGETAFCRALIDAGADTQAVDARGRNAFERAIDAGNFGFAQVLSQHARQSARPDQPSTLFFGDE